MVIIAIIRRMVTSDIVWVSIVCTPPLFAGGGGGGLNLQPNFEKGGLDRTPTFRGGCWEGGADFSGGRCNFHIKNQLKSQIFNDKKSL